MAVRARGLRSGQRDAAAILALILLVSIAAGFVIQQAVRGQETRHAEERAATDLIRFRNRLDIAIAETRALAADAVDDVIGFVAAAELVIAGPVTSVARTDATGARLLEVAGPTVGPLATGARVPAEVRAGLTAAAATGEVRAVAPLGEGDIDAIAIGAPAYPPGTPADVASRRAAVDSFVLSIITLDELQQATRTRPELWPGTSVLVRTPEGSLGSAPTVPVIDQRIAVTGSVWRVTAGAPPTEPVRIGWLVAGAGAAAAAAAYVAIGRQQGARHRAEAEAADRARQLELIAATSTSLQDSLDLADLLPTFAVALADEFDLEHLSILAADDSGALHEAFRLGADHPAGQTVDFELRRGWRAVGRLRATGRRTLADVERHSIQALCDLLAVAMSNADLFRREQQAATRLRDLDVLKNAFLGTVSHELRTSTTAVMGFGELLAEHWEELPEDRRRDLASRICRQAGSLRHLVDDLLDYARLEHETLSVSPRELLLDDLVRQLLDSMSPLVADHEVVLDIPESPVAAYVDPVAVERILANLLSNAGKYSPRGSTVTVSVHRADDRARLVVADEGPGIPVEERRRVFVRFYRLPNAETIRTRGAGIGLAILRDFATKSGAHIAIDDAPGGGARLTVDFPTSPPLEADAAAITGGVSS